jgi:hypothetical protein
MIRIRFQLVEDLCLPPPAVANHVLERLQRRHDGNRWDVPLRCRAEQAVDDYKDFESAVGYIRINWVNMRENCEKCFKEYIRPNQRYKTLVHRIGELKPQK